MGFRTVVIPIALACALSAAVLAVGGPGQAGAASVAPTSGAAPSSVTVVSQRSYDTHSEDVKSATVVCPSGTVALGSGGNIVPGVREIRLNNVHAAGPYGYASASELPEGFDGNWTIWAYAVCGRPPTGFGLQKNRIGGTSETTAGPAHSVEAHCPAGTTLLYAGGWVNDYQQGPAPFALTQMTPIDNGTGLRVTGTADASFTGTWNVSAQGECVDASVGLVAYSWSRNDSVNGHGGYCPRCRLLDVPCPSMQVYSVGSTVYAGLSGAGGPLTDTSAFLSAIMPSARAAWGWNSATGFALGSNDGPPLIWGMTVTAICGPRF